MIAHGVKVSPKVVLVPWLARTDSIGISLLLPWVALPLMAALNLFGLRQVLRELGAGVPVTTG